jgi:hypothetical protein
VKIVSILKANRLIFAIAICAAISGSTSAPSGATDVRRVHLPKAKHARTSPYYGNWFDRCAYARYYCLYSWHGYVYSYPFDDLRYARHLRRHKF